MQLGMGRPRKIRELNPVSAAVVKLREESGLSQQAFSNQLGIAMVTVAKYESGRLPTGKSLTALHRFATAQGRFDLAKIFEDALLTEIGLTRTESPFHPFLVRLMSLFARGVKKYELADALEHHWMELPHRENGEDEIGDQLGKATDELATLLLKADRGSVDPSEVKHHADNALTAVSMAVIRWVNLHRELTGGEPVAGDDAALVKMFRDFHLKLAKNREMSKQ